MDAMDPVRLRHFLAVYEAGNFARAAAQTGVSQPAISKSIRSLEQLLSLKLFNRGRLGAQPTEFATLLVSHARIILAEGNLARAELLAMGNADASKLAIGASVSLAQTLLPAAIGSFGRRWPNVTMSVEVGLSAPLFEALLAGTLDFVISAPPVGTALDPALVQSFLLDEKDALVVGAGHPLAGRTDTCLKDLLDFPWIVPRRSGRLRHIHHVFAAADLPPPARLLRSESVDLARALLNAEPYICLIGDRIFDGDIRAGSLAMLPDLGLSTTRPAFITQRRRSRPRPAAANLIALLRDG
jgi:DNA-binding transcriptional LysR family regulator